MKKTFIYRAASVMLAAVTVSATLFAQDITNGLSPGQLIFHENYVAPAEQLDFTEKKALPLNEINIRAARDFAKGYKNVTDIKWYKSNEGFVAYCMHESTKIKVYYDLHGHFKCTVRTYTEAELPKDVRHLVKSTYYDFEIYYVTEISSAFEKAYIIKLEGRSSWNEVKVMNNEIVSVGEYSKDSVDK